jgi:adenylylsulfate kinase
VPVPTLFITGTVGVGKSAVAAEVSDALAALKVPNAAVDLDALVWQWPSTSSWNDDLMFENLASLWPNYAQHGATHLVLARVLESPAELTRYTAAVPGAAITVCRLVAPAALRVNRLLGRMPPGPSRDWHLSRTAELEAILDRLPGVDFTIENGDRTVRDVALDVLVHAGWVTAEDADTVRLEPPESLPSLSAAPAGTGTGTTGPSAGC